MYDGTKRDFIYTAGREALSLSWQHEILYRGKDCMHSGRSIVVDLDRVLAAAVVKTEYQLLKST